MTELKHNNLEAKALLEAMNDGVYATDRDRRIVYWSPAAERITGWRQKDILGKRCADNVLCHVDKDGRLLCSIETCPLHRAIVTEQGSKLPIIVFAQCSDGHRIPMRVSVAPIRNASGEVIGGVEAFREVSEELQDAQMARRIQTTMLSKAGLWQGGFLHMSALTQYGESINMDTGAMLGANLGTAYADGVLRPAGKPSLRRSVQHERLRFPGTEPSAHPGRSAWAYTPPD